MFDQSGSGVAQDRGAEAGIVEFQAEKILPVHSVDQRREMLHLVLDHVNVKPATRLGYIRFDEQRIEIVWR